MKKILLSALTLLTLASCQKDTDLEEVNRNNSTTNKVALKSDETFISAEEAVKIAKKFVLNERVFGPETKSIQVNYNMTYTDLGDGPTTKASSKSPAYYIYNLNDKGYVIVSAHKAANPILGYSMNGAFNSKSMPEGLISVLDGYSKGINKARELKVKPNEKTAVARAQMLSPGTLTKADWPAIKPILGAIKWNQKPYYNDLCPHKDPVGCVATAAAQIMRYWKYPKKSEGSNTYYNGYKYGDITYNFDRSWDWDAMPEETLTSSNEEVASISLAVAVSVNMDFGKRASSAVTSDVAKAMRKYFKYPSTIRYAKRSEHTDEEWKQLIYNELKAGRPIEYCGFGKIGGHAFVCDGYSSKGYFHFNWGWGGMSDGYFLIDALNPEILGTGGGAGDFNDDQGAVVGFAPPEGWNNSNSNNNANNSTNNKVITYPASKAETSKYTHIAKVSFGDKTITSGASNSGYKDYTNQPFAVDRGTKVPIEFQPGFYHYKYKMYWRVWMDSNKDGQFTDNEIITSFSDNKGKTSELNIDKALPTGNYRVRVSAKYGSFPTPSESFDHGEVEDFTLEVK